MTPFIRLVGKIKRLKPKSVGVIAESIIIFRVGDKYYPNTQDNREAFEAYLHTGDEFYLMSLTDEMEG